MGGGGTRPSPDAHGDSMKTRGDDTHMVPEIAEKCYLQELLRGKGSFISYYNSITTHGVCGLHHKVSTARGRMTG